MARQDCTAGVAAAELPLGPQHSPCGAQEGVVVDRLAVAAELAVASAVIRATTMATESVA
ncbi:MAG: hypothetical protein IPI08_07895 [Betaproteobacteria bacterium]|nr:hypothetical protein [Betaproteobacteria bacterium]